MPVDLSQSDFSLFAAGVEVEVNWELGGKQEEIQ